MNWLYKGFILLRRLYITLPMYEEYSFGPQRLR